MNLIIPGIELPDGAAPRPTMDSMAKVHAAHIKSAERELERLDEEIRDIEFEIEELEGRKSVLEDQYRDAEYDMKGIRSEGDAHKAMAHGIVLHEGSVRIACKDCGLDWIGDTDSALFRAERHAEETGHPVAAVLPGGSVFIPSDCLDLEVSA